jgi:hypothetical protein
MDYKQQTQDLFYSCEPSKVIPGFVEGEEFLGQTKKNYQFSRMDLLH